MLGVVAALFVTVAPSVGAGLTAHAALLWSAALLRTALVSPTVAYAGVVQPKGLAALDETLRPALRRLPYELAYHLPTMLPVAVAVLVLSGVPAGGAALRTGTWGRAVAAVCVRGGRSRSRTG